MFPAVISLGFIGGAFGLLLAYISRKFHVSVDKRVAEIEEVLPGANCGACGYPGCSGFAAAVAKGEADIAGCIPGGSSVADKIADIMGTETGEYVKMMAVVHCKGGDAEAADKIEYYGINDCRAAALLGGGQKQCAWGCLGMASCVKVCPFDAIHINDNGVAVVDPVKCTACGKCVDACPKGLIEIIPFSSKIFLACSNKQRGAKVKRMCTVGCTACKICVKNSKEGSIEMKDNLPVLDYDAEENFVVAKYKCPQDCFVDIIRHRPKVNIDINCDGCGKCVEVCPVKGAINGEEGQRHIIDKQKCIGCGRCLGVCPVKAIKTFGALGYSKN